MLCLCGGEGVKLNPQYQLWLFNSSVGNGSHSDGVYVGSTFIILPNCTVPLFCFFQGPCCCPVKTEMLGQSCAAEQAVSSSLGLGGVRAQESSVKRAVSRLRTKQQLVKV